MNLHNISGSNNWLWITIAGGNGRSIGTHAYELEEGTPPPLRDDDRPTWAGPWWLPSRFHWHPWSDSINTLMRDGYVRPLCGRTSRARWPRAQVGYGQGCTSCERIARTRGIMIQHYYEAMLDHTLYLQIQAEREVWQRAHPA